MNYHIETHQHKGFAPSIQVNIKNPNISINISGVNWYTLAKLIDVTNKKDARLGIDGYNYSYIDFNIEKDTATFVPRPYIINDHTKKIDYSYKKSPQVNMKISTMLPLIEELITTIESFGINCDYKKKYMADNECIANNEEDEEVLEDGEMYWKDNTIISAGITESGKYHYTVKTPYIEDGNYMTHVTITDKASNKRIINFKVIHCEEYMLILKNNVKFIPNISKDYTVKSDQLPIIHGLYNVINIYDKSYHNVPQHVKFNRYMIYDSKWEPGDTMHDSISDENRELYGYYHRKSIMFYLSDFSKIFLTIYDHMDISNITFKNAKLRSYWKIYPKEGHEGHTFYMLGIDEYI